MRKDVWHAGGTMILWTERSETRLRMRRNLAGPGYWLEDELIPCFREDPQLSPLQRYRVAKWAVEFTPGDATAEQHRIAAAPPVVPPEIRAAVERQFEEANPDLGRLDDRDRALARNPSRHPALAGREYPLTEAELATFAGVAPETIRRWVEEKELIGRPVGGGARVFYVPAGIRALAMARGVAGPCPWRVPVAGALEEPR